MQLYLMTPSVPDFPYSGGPVVRRIIQHLDFPITAWICLVEYNGGAAVNDTPVLALPGFKLPYRIRLSFLGSWIRSHLMAEKRAGIISKKIRESGSDCIVWATAEGDCVHVAYYLVRKYGIKVHLTFFDAPEVFTSNFQGYSRRDESLYLDRIRYLLHNCRSIDAISDSMMKHLMLGVEDINGIVFQPSYPEEYFANAPELYYGYDQGVRRIGFCGSLRETDDQWSDFLALIGRSDYSFEFIVYADEESFPNADLPDNVEVKIMEYMETEEELMTSMRAQGIWALYLSVWKDESMKLFARTSLSSKLATYATIGLPVLYNGPVDSVGWDMISRYDCGIRIDDESEARKELARLLENKELWIDKGRNIQRMGSKEFNIQKNILKFKKLLAI